jgi:NAD(P)-dependent dehydrogenase (short-subunit alcohol dehydrogenase family)
LSKRILITGGASGLGKALARSYLRRGWSVLITDVHAERGETTARELGDEGTIHFLVADTTAEEDWGRVRTWVEDHFGGLDVLVNNAGVAAAGRIDRISMEDWDWIIDVNLKGVVRGCRTFVPLFKEQGNGHVVNIASLAAVANVPAMNSYNVTKAGVLSLSETLRYELLPYGIRTTVVCPGFFQTNLAENLRTPEPGMLKTVEKLLAGGKLSAEDVAERIVRGVDRGIFLVFPQPEGRILHAIKHYAPFLYRRGLAKAGRKMKERLENSI